MCGWVDGMVERDGDLLELSFTHPMIPDILVSDWLTNFKRLSMWHNHGNGHNKQLSLSVHFAFHSLWRINPTCVNVCALNHHFHSVIYTVNLMSVILKLFLFQEPFHTSSPFSLFLSHGISCTDRISHLHRLKFPANPTLKYLYPPPSSAVLTNISHTLLSVPKFYVQVHGSWFCCWYVNKVHTHARAHSTTYFSRVQFDSVLVFWQKYIKGLVEGKDTS